MKRVLFIGDPHLKVNRFDLAVQFLNWINTIIVEQKPDLVINLGDTFDTHAVLRSEVLNEFMNHVYRVTELNIPYVYLLGNHDMYRPNDAKYHAMLPFKDKIKNLYVIDEVCDLFDMTFVPYQRDCSKFPTKTLPIVIAHQTFIGADYGPIRDKEGVDKRCLSSCERVISGHIHTRQTLVGDQEGPEILYVGSPFSQSAADIDQVKGVSIIDVSSFREEFFESPLPTWRRFCGVVQNDTKIDDLHKLLIDKINNTKDHWVIELEGPRAELVAYLDSIQYKDLIANVDVKVKTKFTDKEKKNVSIEARSMENIISDYINKVYDGSLDKDKIVDGAKALLQEVRSSQ